MAIKSLSIPRNAKIKDGFEGSLSLQQIRIVKEKYKVTKLGKDTTGKQVQKNNEEAPKRDYKTVQIPSTNEHVKVAVESETSSTMSNETWTFYD
jgi:hypothetical protein